MRDGHAAWTHTPPGRSSMRRRCGYVPGETGQVVRLVEPLVQLNLEGLQCKFGRLLSVGGGHVRVAGVQHVGGHTKVSAGPSIPFSGIVGGADAIRHRVEQQNRRTYPLGGAHQGYASVWESNMTDASGGCARGVALMPDRGAPYPSFD